MKWFIERGTISKLFKDGENIIYPWGFETADSSAFFSLEEGIGYRHEILEKSINTTDISFNAQYVVRMKEGLWKLEIEDEIHSSNRISRKAILTCLEKSCFMDFVLRFRFRKSFYPIAKIAGKEIPHKNSNIYHQYPVLEAALPPNLHLRVVDYCNSKQLSPFMYVRDLNDEWIVHARMLPCKWNKEVIKLCNAWAKTKPLPQMISKPLLAVDPIRNALWYRPERKPFTNKILKRINPSAIPIATLAKGEILNWHVEVMF